VDGRGIAGLSRESTKALGARETIKVFRGPKERGRGGSDFGEKGVLESSAVGGGWRGIGGEKSQKKGFQWRKN